jgi:signal transduction histidine kinase
MSIIKKIVFAPGAFFFSLSSFSQTHRIDSLKKQIILVADNNKKSDIILALCNEKNSLPSDTLYHYAIVAKELADSLNDKLKKTWAEYYMAFSLVTKGMSDSSLAITDEQLKSLHFTPSLKDVYSKFCLLKANALVRLSKPKEALTVLYALLNEGEKHGDILTQIWAQNHIGAAYTSIGQYKEAQQWFYKALRMTPEPVSELYREVYCVVLSNIGVSYIELYKTESSKQNADSCEYYETMAINACREYEYISTLAFSLNLNGTILSYTNRTKEAESFLKEGLEIRKQIGDPYYIIIDMIGLGNFYLNTNQQERGVAICKEGITISNQFRLYAQLIPLYQILAENYKAESNYTQYGETLKELVNLKDSLYKKNSADQLAEMEAKYEVQGKENIIIKQKYNLTRKNYFIYGALGLLFVTLLFSYFFLQNRRKTQKLKMQAFEMEQKRETTRSVMQAEEEERKKIAADLHDSVAQKMVAARLNLEAFGNQLPVMDDDQKKIFSNIDALLDQSCTEVRELSHSMMPQAFSRSGITDAVKDLLDKIERKDMQTHFSGQGDFKNIPDDTALMIYRIIQECVQNALKHAKATKLDVAMIVENNEVDVTVEDNGIGFAATGLHETNSLGMKNIRSRIEYLNGKLDINSEPGNGTVIAFYIPLYQP